MTTPDDDATSAPNATSATTAPNPDPTDAAPPAPKPLNTERRKIRLKRIPKPAPLPPKPKKKIRLIRRKADPAPDADQDPTPPGFGTSGDPDDVVYDGTFEGDLGSEATTEGLTRMVRSILDGVGPRVIKRILASGGDKLTEDGLRRILRDTPMPNEVTGFLAGQLDHVKDEFYDILTREIQRFLQSINIAGELQRLLTSLSFEIRTEIRFIPNDQAVKPQVRNRVRVKRDKNKDAAPTPDEGQGDA